ncbi:glycosyltransferase, partial [Neorhizobium galegae]|nr:glycosyltransferase [Neorhizobium galegae]
MIDSDLEEEPEWLSSFSAQMDQEACDVIYGVQERRKGKWFERWSGQWFSYLLKTLTGFALPQNLVTARLMTKCYVEALLIHLEREVFMAGLWRITGFAQSSQGVKKRSISETTCTFRRKMSILVNSVTSFGNAPLVSIFYISVSISLLSIFYMAYLIAQRFFLATPLTGWTSVMASIWLLGGMVISNERTQ